MPIVMGPDARTRHMSDTPPPIPPVTPPTPPEPTPRTFTQDEVNRMMTVEKSEGRQAALNQFLKDLDVESVDKAKEVLAAAKALEDANKTELQRALDENEALKRDTDSKVGSAAGVAHKANIKLALLLENVPLPEDKTKAAEALDTLVALVQVPVGGSAEEIQTKISSLKEQFPLMFTASVTPPPVLPNGLPSGNPTQQPGVKTGLEYGRQVAQQQAEAKGIKPAS